MNRWVIPAVVAALVPATGLVTVGLVTTESMAPTLPADSLFVAIPGDPQVGDVVVYQAPEGHRVVHRVVDRTPEGLVTKGDANAQTDQEAGLPPVRADQVQVVPEVAGQLVALPGDALVPAALVIAQVGLLTLGLKGLATGGSAVPGLPEIRAWHLFVLAGAVLLASAPLHHQQVEADDGVAVSAWLMPTTVRVADAGGVQHVTVAPLGTTTVAASGTVDVVRAPAVPGARLLSSWGATLATLPAAATVWTGGWVARSLEVGRWT